jgi:hypothetical protein
MGRRHRRAFRNACRSGATGAFCLDKPLKGSDVFTVADETSAVSKRDDNVSNAIFGLLSPKNAVKNQKLLVTTTDQDFAAAFTPILINADDALINALKSER